MIPGSTNVILLLYAFFSMGGTLPNVRLHSATFAWVTITMLS